MSYEDSGAKQVSPTDIKGYPLEPGQYERLKKAISKQMEEGREREDQESRLREELVSRQIEEEKRQESLRDRFAESVLIDGFYRTRSNPEFRSFFCNECTTILPDVIRRAVNNNPLFAILYEFQLKVVGNVDFGFLGNNVFYGAITIGGWRAVITYNGIEVTDTITQHKVDATTLEVAKRIQELKFQNEHAIPPLSELNEFLSKD
jgi:hypothetical protein